MTNGIRARIIAIALRWAAGEPRPHDPREVRLAQAAGEYGLPPLAQGDSEDAWVEKVKTALRQERKGFANH